MWVLQSSQGDLHYLVPGKHVVGRRDCDLVLADDKSISRNHAVLEVFHPQQHWNNPKQCPTVELTDSRSKYGTTVVSRNGTLKMEIGAKKVLSEGDEIHFGLQWNKWKVLYHRLVVVMSALPKQVKEKVKPIVVGAGGVVVNEWVPEASILTMSSITLTVKAISALAYAKPIVSPAYWDAYKNAIEAKTDIPSHEEFIPPLGETVINKHEVSFLVNENRRNLFQGKTFVFFSEPQFKEHGCLVAAAGGKIKLGKIANNYEQFLKQDIVVMQYLFNVNSQNTQNTQPPQPFIELTKLLKLHGKRPVPSSEIGLAILHCSVEKFCNPDFNFSSVLFGRAATATQDTLDDKILVKETQTSESSIAVDIVIPDSGSEPKKAAEAVMPSAAESHASQVTDGSQSTQMCIESSQADTTCLDPAPRTRQLPKRKIVELDDNREDEYKRPPSKRSNLLSHRRIVNLDSSDDEDKQFSKKSNAFEKKVLKKTGSNPDHKLSLTGSVYSENNDDDPDDLFEEFKVSRKDTRLSGHSVISKLCASREDDAEALFGEFEADPRLSKQPQTLSTPVQRQATACKAPESMPSIVAVAGPSKRVRLEFSDDEDGLPNKKLSKLDIRRTPKEPEPENDVKSQDFVAMGKVKHDGVGAEKSGCNVSVVLKLLVMKAEVAVTSEPTVAPENNKNFKKFRKVKPTNDKIIPQIIGGCDLQPFKPTTVGGPGAAFLDLRESDEEDGDRAGDLWAALTQRKGAVKSRARRL